MKGRAFLRMMWLLVSLLLFVVACEGDLPGNSSASGDNVVDASEAGESIMALSLGDLHISQSAVSMLSAGADLKELLGDSLALPEGIKLEVAVSAKAGDTSITIKVIVETAGVGKSDGITISIKSDWVEDKSGAKPQGDVDISVKLSPEPVKDKNGQIVCSSDSTLQLENSMILKKVSFQLINMSFNSSAQSAFKAGAKVDGLVKNAPEWVSVVPEKDISVGDASVTLVFSGTSPDNKAESFSVAFKREWLTAGSDTKELSAEYPFDFSVVAEDLTKEPTLEERKAAFLRVMHAREPTLAVVEGSAEYNENLVWSEIDYSYNAAIREEKRSKTVRTAGAMHEYEIDSFGNTVTRDLYKFEGGTAYKWDTSGLKWVQQNNLRRIGISDDSYLEMVAKAVRDESKGGYVVYLSGDDDCIASSLAELESMEGYRGANSAVRYELYFSGKLFASAKFFGRVKSEDSFDLAGEVEVTYGNGVIDLPEEQ